MVLYKSYIRPFFLPFIVPLQRWTGMSDFSALCTALVFHLYNCTSHLYNLYFLG